MNKKLFETEVKGHAKLSGCRKYRYALWRHWNEPQARKKQVMFIGLNPSTADEQLDDPTIRRCMGFARTWGFNGIIMVNAFAFRATKPKDMKAAQDPIGPDNEYALKFYSNKADLIVAAWGAHCDESREKEVCETINKAIYCLGTTKAGRPRHPLYLKKETKPVLFWNDAKHAREQDRS